MFQIHDHPLTGHRVHTCKCTALCAIGGERDEEPQVVGICTWLLWHNSIPLLELWHHSILTRTLLGLCHISFKKSGCMQDEFNFAFAHWGNDSSIFAHAYWLNYTRWFWDGHMHSTMAPQAIQASLPRIENYHPAKEFEHGQDVYTEGSWRHPCEQWKAESWYPSHVWNNQLSIPEYGHWKSVFALLLNWLGLCSSSLQKFFGSSNCQSLFVLQLSQCALL